MHFDYEADICIRREQCAVLRRRILLDNTAHLLLVRSAVLLEEVESICLRRRLWVWLIEQ